MPVPTVRMTPPQRFLDMYDNADVPDPAIGDWCGRYAKQLNPEEAASDAPYGNFGNEYVRNSKRHYYANITFKDSMIRYADERFVIIELILEDESGLKIPNK